MGEMSERPTERTHVEYGVSTTEGRKRNQVFIPASPQYAAEEILKGGTAVKRTITHTTTYGPWEPV